MGQDKILILGSKESFIIRVLLKKLADAGIDAEFTTLSVEKINDYWEDISLVTFYMEQDERLDDEIRTFLVDKMEDDDEAYAGQPSYG